MRIQRSDRTSNVTSGHAAWELIAGVKAITLFELELSLAAATASTYGFGFPAAIGITPTTPKIGVIIDNTANGLPTVLGATALAWGTEPTIPADFLKRISFPATIGTTIKWEFKGSGLYVPAAKSIILWNLASDGVLDVNATWEE